MSEVLSKKLGPVLLCVLFILLPLIGCGGGGGGGGSDSGAGIGSGLGGAGLTSQSRVRINFAQALNLSRNKIQIASDLDYAIMMVNRHMPVGSGAVELDKVLGHDPSISEIQKSELQAKVLASNVRYNNLAAVKNKLTQFKVIITAPDLVLPVIAIFPSTATEGEVSVEAGSFRKIRVEGIGVDLDGISKVLIAAEATVNLSPALTTSMGGTGSEVPVEFEEVDSTPPITALFHAGSGPVEGPHREAVNIILSNFENATISYRITEVGNPNSQLNALTSGFVTAVSTATINLAQEATYLFEYSSTDSAGNQETINEKQVIVNFNLNPPVSSTNYRGRPYKVLAGSKLGFSIAMQNQETATLNIQVGTGNQQTSPVLKNNEQYLVTLGNEGVLPTDPLLNVQFSSTISGGSAEVSAKSTTVELIEFLKDGQNIIKFEGTSNHVLTSGAVLFCDDDSTSIFNSATCNNQGKLQVLLTGPFEPGNADDFPCVEVKSGNLVVVDQGATGACQSCSTFQTASNISCP